MSFEEFLLNDLLDEDVTLDIVCDDKKYLPQYANETDACMDLKVKINTTDLRRTVDDMDISYDDTENSMWIMPNEARTFNTGIKVAIPTDYVMLIYPRSSTGFKLNCMLANSTGVIDSGYRDEIMVKLHNFGSEPVEIVDGQRVAQFIIIPRPKIKLNIVKDDEDFRKNDRGGGIGSTGLK